MIKISQEKEIVMEKINKLELSEKEKKYLIRVEKNVNNIYIHYFLIITLLCFALVGVIIGIKLKKEEGFFMCILFGYMALILFLNIRKTKKLFKIINKLKGVYKIDK